jgi:hypothetical protein
MKTISLLLIFFAANLQANPPQTSINFSDRLTNSFNTVPAGRIQHRVVVVKELKGDQFDDDEKLRQVGCAFGDKKCEARIKENMLKAGYNEKPYDGEVIF